ncbi:MAG: helix-turn-helix transcriptional regulator [Dorea sp.]|jgi:transcriptional regulator with XRE-family HTH domain|nr:helix-turn-helix transcriptional regulator [Dorea sp.]
MSFGEKLFKLRKEKGLSQESLAEQLGTTRQAISKWENNQGFPETEKLLQLSNIFETSVDFLLKDEQTSKDINEKGYYVSKEMATAYIANQKKISSYIGIGFMFWAMAGIPYVMFTTNLTWRYLGMAVFTIIGIASFILGAFSEQEQYKILKEEPLIFDHKYLKELSDAYQAKKRIYVAMLIPSIILFITGILAISLTVKGKIIWSEYHSFVFLGFALGLFGFCYCAGVIDAYELLIKNEYYSSSMSFKIKRKIKNKINNL